MKQDLKNSMFHKETSITREELKVYGETKDEGVKHSIEEKSLGSDFDQDAMEGWEELGYDTSVMNNLDKKFAPRNGSYLYITIAAVTLIGIVSFYLMYDFTGNEENTTIAENITGDKTATDQTEVQEIFTVEAEDIIIDESIEEMQEVNAVHQVQPKTMQQEFVKIDSFNKANPTGPNDEVTFLPIEPIDEPVHTEIVQIKESGKEVYLSDLKLIDYRQYRTKPEISTKQLVLTGTPANMEGTESEEPETTWKEVEIPYIDYLSKTMRIFSKNNYKKSLSRFQTILNTYPDDVNGLFYGAICLYNLGEYDQAINYFSKCKSGLYSNFDEEANWLTALCYEKSGKKDLAAKYFKSIADRGGFYSDQAKEKLKK